MAKNNGEAIYGTRPWKIYGEGPTRNVGGASFSEKKDTDYTAQDIRFTTKADSLYAIFLSWPGRQATVHTLSENESLWFGRVQRVTMLGLQAPLKWRQDVSGL